MKPVVILLTLGLLGLGLGGCGSPESDSPGEKAQLHEAGDDFTPVIAEVGDLKITQGYFDYRYENLPPGEKARFTGEGWQERFLDELVEEALVYLKAKEEGFQNLREIEYRIDLATRSILFKAYYDHYFKENLEIPEEEIQNYYEQNREAFASLPRAMAYHVQTSSKEKIEKAAEALEGGKSFDQVVKDFSEDESTRSDRGLLGWFNPDGYVLGMGFNKEFTDYVFTMEPHTTSPPVQIGDNWHIIKTGSIVEGESQTLEEVRERIERQLRPAIARETYEKRLRDLKQDYGVSYFGEFDVKETRTAEQLYRLAGESRDPRSRLHYYESLVENYPDDERADEALFMKGFIHSEEFGEVSMATRAFSRLREEYPDSEWIESAIWLSKNAGRSVPSLRGESLPGDANEAGDRIKKAQD